MLCKYETRVRTYEKKKIVIGFSKDTMIVFFFFFNFYRKYDHFISQDIFILVRLRRFIAVVVVAFFFPPAIFVSGLSINIVNMYTNGKIVEFFVWKKKRNNIYIYINIGVGIR